MITKEQDRIYHRAYYQAHREETLARTSAYSKSHREQENARRRVYRSIPENAAKINATRQRYRTRSNRELSTFRLRRYGITAEQFDFLLQKQGGACAICKSSEWGSKKPHVDHHHNQNIVRGILCGKCNLALGLINDDAEIAQSMSRYLKNNGTTFAMAILSEDKEK